MSVFVSRLNMLIQRQTSKSQCILWLYSPIIPFVSINLHIPSSRDTQCSLGVHWLKLSWATALTFVAHSSGLPSSPNSSLLPLSGWCFQGALTQGSCNGGRWEAHLGYGAHTVQSSSILPPAKLLCASWIPLLMDIWRRVRHFGRKALDRFQICIRVNEAFFRITISPQTALLRFKALLVQLEPLSPLEGVRLYLSGSQGSPRRSIVNL